MQKNDLLIYCDGGSRGNPGKAASAFVVTSNKQSLPHGGEKVIYKEGKYLGIETNNVAEYSAVLMALDWIIKNKVIEDISGACRNAITINLDSQLIERQINGFYKVKNETLKKLHSDVKEKLEKISKACNCVVNFQWNYRTDNKLADSLVNEELDRSSV